VRTGARIRGNCILGDCVVVGGEIKSSILMDEASFPHQSYVGDSICVRRIISSLPLSLSLALVHVCMCVLEQADRHRRCASMSSQGFRSHFGNGATRYVKAAHPPLHGVY
jgi:hypothetical protein